MNFFSWLTLLLAQLALLAQVAANVQLTELAHQSDDFVIQVHNSDLDILDKVRDYYTLITLTSTNPQHGCEVCHDLNKVLLTVSRTWNQNYGDLAMLYFVTVDIVDASNMGILQYLKMDTVPHTWLIPPSGPEVENDGENSEKYDPMTIFKVPHYAFKLPTSPFDAQVAQLCKFLTELTGMPISMQENPTIKFLKTFLIVFTVIMVIKKQGKLRFKGVKKKHFYIILTIGLTLIFVGGYQFTLDQAVPFVAKNDKGGLIVISGGTQYQFGIEILLSLANYAGLATALVLLIYIGQYKITETSKIKSETTKFALILINNAALFLLYSCLTSMFTRKDHDYPFGFVKLF